jgi:heterogeneous nuclear ribonucleoprotein A1/A3
LPHNRERSPSFLRDEPKSGAETLVRETKKTLQNKLFVGGLAWATDDASLRTAFEEFGPVTDAKVILDRDTGRSRGFGFVTYADDESAGEAVKGLDGAELDGRRIRVNVAQERERRGGGGGGGGGRGRGGGGGGGGYGGGGGGYGGGGYGGGGGRGRNR